MITTMFIVIFTALWTLFNIILLLFGHKKDKTQNAQRIHPNNIIHKPRVSLNSNAQMSLLNLAENSKSQNSLKQKYSQNQNYDQGIDEVIQCISSSNMTPQNFLRTPQIEQQKAPQTPQHLTRRRRATMMRKTQLKMPNGEIVSTFSFKSAQKNHYSAVIAKEQRRQSTDFNTQRQQQEDQSPKYPPSQISRNRTFNQVFPQSELQTQHQPLQDTKKNMRWNQICYLMSKNRKQLNRTFQIYVIYFRTILCLDLVGFLVYFKLHEISIYLIYVISLLFVIFSRIVDYHLLKQINNNIHQRAFRVTFILLWTLSIVGILYLLIFQQLDDILWLYLFTPSFVFDMILLDPINYIIMRKCCQRIRRLPQKSSKIDVVKILNTIK